MKKKTFFGIVIMVLGMAFVGLVPYNATGLDVTTTTRPCLGSELCQPNRGQSDQSQLVQYL